MGPRSIVGGDVSARRRASHGRNVASHGVAGTHGTRGQRRTAVAEDHGAPRGLVQPVAIDRVGANGRRGPPK